MQELHAMLILNGKHALDESVRAAVSRQREQGWSLSVRVTWEDGDIARSVREAKTLGIKYLIAGGGDGTVSEVAACMLHEELEASLVVLALGTANDFARAANLPLTPEQALALLDIPPVRVDLGRLNQHWFLNMATGGFGSQVTATTPASLKKALGGAAYLVTGLVRLAEADSVHACFSAPEFHWQGALLAFGVGNGRQAGGGQLLCPQAFVNDGLLDLCIVPAADGAIGDLGTLISGGLRGVETVAVNAQMPWLEVSVPGGVDLNLDGEPQRYEHMRFEVKASALSLHLPSDSPLLRS